MANEQRSAGTNNVTDREIAGWLADPAGPGELAEAGSSGSTADDGRGMGAAGAVGNGAAIAGAAGGIEGLPRLTRGNAWELARWLAEAAPGDVGPVELEDGHGLSPEFVQRLQSRKLGNGTRVPPVPQAVAVPSRSRVRERLAVVLALGVNAAVWTFALAWALGKVA